jgi:c(7)-type cytochrome triheme protein
LDTRSCRILCFGPIWVGLLVAQFVDPAVALGDAKGAPDSSRAAPIELRLPADIVYSLVVSSDSSVVFSHKTHVAFAGNRCTGCHSRPFPMLRRGPAQVHRDMDAGGGCGMCHDGKQAFGVLDSDECRTCHSGAQVPRTTAAGATAQAGGTARRLPGPHAYPRSESSPGTVTFRHEPHLVGVGGCAGCHPKPFEFRSVPPRPDGGMHERAACGACHDGKQAFAADDPDACSRCHVEAGARP